MSNQPARSRKLSIRMPMETATNSVAKRQELTKQAKAKLQAMARPKTQAERLQLEIAMIHARDTEEFHRQTRADLPLKGIDYLGNNVSPNWSDHE